MMRPRGEPQTRFAQLLAEYMIAHRPWPLDQVELARQIGVSGNAVHGWLKRGKLPRNIHEMVPRIAAATGIPQSALYESLGMRLPGNESAMGAMGEVRVVEVDRFGELINDMRHQSRLTPAQKWFAIEAAYERHYGLDRPREWIEAEHDVTVAPTEPSLPAISPSPLDQPSTNAQTNPAHAAADEAARTDGIAK